MIRKTKRRGGVISAIRKPLGKAVFTLGESLGRDYLEKKSIKVVKGIYEDKSLATNPGFLLTGIKPQKDVKIQTYGKENIYDNANIKSNLAGRTKRKYKRKTRKYKRKTRKNKK